MKYLLVVGLSVFLASCGGSSGSKSSDKSTILSSFTSSNSSIPSLDFRAVRLGEESLAKTVITSETCSGTITGNPAKTSVSDHSVLVAGTEKEGTISFGRLLSPEPRVEGNQCRVVATEVYSYKVANGKLRLCNLNCLNGVYPTCQSEELACTTLSAN